MVQYLASHPDEREMEILGYDINSFWKLEKHFAATFLMFLILPDNPLKQCPMFSLGKLRECSEEDEELLNYGEEIPISINEESETVIGEYEIPYKDFRFMAQYIVRDGWFGWEDNQKLIMQMKQSKP